jgi:hypothetical protein
VHVLLPPGIGRQSWRQSYRVRVQTDWTLRTHNLDEERRWHPIVIHVFNTLNPRMIPPLMGGSINLTLKGDPRHLR